MEDTSQLLAGDTQFFREIFNASPVGIAIEDLEGQPLFVNPSLCRLLGLNQEELLSKHCVQFSPPQDAHKDWTLFQQLKAGKIDRYSLEKRYLRKDGSVVWGSLSVSLFNRGNSRFVLAMAEDITEKKKAEEELRMSEERLRLAQQVGQIGTFERDIRTGVLTWNSEMEALYGLPNGSFGQKLSDFENLIHHEDRARVLNLVQRASESGEPTDAEWRVIWPDGSLHWLAGRWQVFRDDSGNPARGIGVNMDITKRKEAENRLREYERVVDGVEELIFVVDRQYRFLMANREFLRRLNLTSEEVVGRFAEEFYEQDFYQNALKPQLEECFRGKIVRFDVKRVHPGLGERDLLAAFYPVEDKNGMDRAVCVQHDITERKQAERALTEVNRALEAQTASLQSRDELLKTFVKSVPAAVAMLDRDMRYVQVSDRWCSDNSVEASELLGRSREVFPEMPERWKEVNRRALQGETLRADEDRWESGGRTRWARWEVRPWRNADGTVGGILILAEDITRRKQMEEELSDMSRKLIESQEQERARIGRELHDDINQRLALVAAQLELLEENPSEVESRIRKLHDEVTEISNDVQALSRELHSSKLEYLGVAAGIKSWCNEFAERQKMQIEFTNEVFGTLPVDLGRTLFRVLQEGVHNASKHSGVKRVDIQLREESGEIHLIVSDTGRGFELESAKKGRGLGLTSMRERVRLVNGTIAIDSKPTGGTTIHVRVPLPSEQVSQRAAS